MLTIEKHLENLTKEHPQFEVLFSIWKLNKKNIPLAQNNISFNFPHYSLHEKSHSETIIRNIESFLGIERIQSLSPTDSWLILMSCYTHDLGMVIFSNEIEKKWKEEGFQDYLKSLPENTNDVDLQKAAILLMNVQNQIEHSKNGLEIPLEVRKSLILVIADYYRRYHHTRSKEMISGVDLDFSQASNGLNLTNIPNRFSVVLSEIAFSHGIDFYSVIDRMEYQANGYANDKMHPRFVAFLLRLGDLLDIDDKRFNIYNEKVLSESLPKSSQVHKEKHASTKHFLINPTSIEITVDCKSDEVYRVAREWFDWLQKEVELQSKEWVNIAPKSTTGLPPLISRGKLKILYNEAEPKQELMNLRFKISNEKVFEMFEGEAIYQDADCVFLREIVQNSLDATKIQLWKEITNGTYDFIIRKHLTEQGIATNTTQHDDLISLIKFPSDIPKEIYENFKITLKMEIDNKHPDLINIIIEDSGTGISEKDLIRMTNSVGESRSKDFEFIKFKKSLPYWLSPTGAFGIGIHSIFLASSSFKIETKAENETAKEVIFLSSKKGEYCRITNKIPTIRKGCRLTVSISSSRFNDMFLNAPNFISNYDYFSDNLGKESYYNAQNYIKHILGDIDLLEVIFFNNILIKKFGKTTNNSLNNYQTLGSYRTHDRNCTLLKKQNNAIEIKMSENMLQIGSDLTLFPKTNFDDRSYHESFKYYVRNIPVDNQSYHQRLSYTDLKWNLLNRSSDKILNISRDRLIRKTKIKIEQQLFSTILPTAIKDALDLIEKKPANLELNQEIAIQYFHLELTAAMCNINQNHDKEIYKDNSFPNAIAITKDGKPVLIKDFFSYKKFLLVYVHQRMRLKDIEDKHMKAVEYVIKKIKIDEDTLICCIPLYFKAYFKFMKAEIFEIEHFSFDDLKIMTEFVQFSSIKQLVHLNLSEETKKVIFSNAIRRLDIETGRFVIIPIHPYSETIAIENNSKYHSNLYFEMNFNNFIAYTTHSIIFPFKNKEEYKSVKQIIENDPQISVEDLRNQIISNHIDQLVPKPLINLIIEQNNNEKKEITEQKIKESYINLIIEIINLK